MSVFIILTFGAMLMFAFLLSRANSNSKKTENTSSCANLCIPKKILDEEQPPSPNIVLVQAAVLKKMHEENLLNNNKRKNNNDF